MKKVLIVYYSRTGNTRKIMKELGSVAGCDVEELVDTKNRNGLLGWIISGKDASSRTKTTLGPTKYDPEQYDVIIIGTPTWASTMSSAVRTYIEQNRRKFRNIAFVTTQAGPGNGKVFDHMAELCGKSAAATCSISGKELSKNIWQSKINDFYKRVV